ncbi:MAG: anhydro-N-acetylmuramic acid kinase [Bradyrhizobiaceae bacterium]|nr:MAG: anhydro-N-acetylmuramic acid kinase [Bradyrhizobiaceae bacterium]
MSGTSLDGADVALIETDGETISAFGPVGYRAYSSAERATLHAALAAAVDIVDRNARPGVVAEAEALITRAHVEAVEALIARNNLRRDEIGIVGFHGQTILHRPHAHLTVQIGDGPALARALKLPVVYDLRAADVAAGGEGAPFVPAYHRALALKSDTAGPVAILNIGGVANITYIDGETLIACDTGPGNALLDDFMLRQTGEAVDRDGALAARGTPDRGWIARALAHPFFALPPPKSLDRNDFAAFTIADMKPEDGAATLTAFTAESIARIVPLLPRPPRSWIVVGGGANNPTLLKMLADALAPARVITGNSLGWSGDAIEAQAFAYLAVRSLKGLPLTYPGTTGVKTPLSGGVLVRP